MGFIRAARRASPLVLLAGLLLLLYGPVLLGSRALLAVHTDQLEPWRSAADPQRLAALDQAWVPLAADKTLMFHPQLERALARLGQGELPQWNPSSLCGVPLLAQGVHGVLHPLNLLASWPGLPRAYGWIAALQAWIAAAGACLLARQLGAGRRAGFLAGVSFGLCGYLSVRSHWFQIQAASIYLPWMLLGVERLFERVRPGALALTAAAVGLSLLAGFPQGSVLALYATAIWALARLVGGWRDDARAARRGAAGAAGAVLIGLCLGLPQLLPTVALAASGESTRAAVTPAQVRSLGSRPAALLTALSPDLFVHPEDAGRHAQPALRDRGVLDRLLLKDRANHVEIAAGFGLVALLLAILGAATPRRGRGPALGLCAAGAALSLDTPLIELAAHLPGLDSGDPRRFVLWLAAGGSLLAAAGLQRLIRSGPPRWFVRLLGGLALAAVLAAGLSFLLGGGTWARAVAGPLSVQIGVPEASVLAQQAELEVDLDLLRRSLGVLALLAAAVWAGAWLARQRHAAAATLLAGLAALELGLGAARMVTALPAEGYFAPPPGRDLLPPSPSGRLARFLPGPSDHALSYPLPPNTGMPSGVRDLSGYITLGPRRVEALHERLQPGSTTDVGLRALHDHAALRSPILDTMAVSHLLSSVPLQEPGLSPLGRMGAAWLYAREGALPRAYLVDNVFVVGDEAEALDVVGRPGYDPRLVTLVEMPDLAAGASLAIVGFEGGGVRLAGPDDPLVAGQPPLGTVTFEADEPELVVLQVLAPAPELSDGEAWLVLSDSLLPGWSVQVDGVPAALQRANVAFRAVAVPAGAHRVTFTYRAPGWETGLRAGLAGAVALAACLGLALAQRLRARAASRATGAA